jgi:hypothetical protein
MQMVKRMGERGEGGEKILRYFSEVSRNKHDHFWKNYLFSDVNNDKSQKHFSLLQSEPRKIWDVCEVLQLGSQTRGPPVHFMRPLH